MPVISSSAVMKLLKAGAPGAYTTESVAKAREIIEDFTRQLAVTARDTANTTKKKRITEEEIKLAAKFLLRT